MHSYKAIGYYILASYKETVNKPVYNPQYVVKIGMNASLINKVKFKTKNNNINKKLLMKYQKEYSKAVFLALYPKDLSHSNYLEIQRILNSVF